MKKIKNIGIDFDGTIAYEGSYPEVGGIIDGAAHAINKLKSMGFTIVIWTCREGDVAEKAIKFLEENGIEYDYFNDNPKELCDMYGNNCRKIGVDVFIDDKNIFCESVNWGEILDYAEKNWILKE